MLDVFKQLAGSKKVFVTVLSIIVWLVAKVGLHTSTDELLPVVGPLWLLVIGQAGADWGKEAAKAAAAAPIVVAPKLPKAPK
jgi:hypothetical protein